MMVAGLQCETIDHHSLSVISFLDSKGQVAILPRPLFQSASFSTCFTAYFASSLENQICGRGVTGSEGDGVNRDVARCDVVHESAASYFPHRQLHPRLFTLQLPLFKKSRLASWRYLTSMLLDWSLTFQAQIVVGICSMDELPGRRNLEHMFCAFDIMSIFKA